MIEKRKPGKRLKRVLRFKNCVVCEKPLSGQQTKFCSPSCTQSQAGREATERMREEVAESPLERIEKALKTVRVKRRGLLNKLELINILSGGFCSYPGCTYGEDKNENLVALEIYNEDLRRRTESISKLMLPVNEEKRGPLRVYCKFHYETLFYRDNPVPPLFIPSRKLWDEKLLDAQHSCSVCGRDVSEKGAAELHHREGDKKTCSSSDLIRKGGAITEDQRAELGKVQVVCPNCYIETHNPDLSFGNLPTLIAQMDKQILLLKEAPDKIA